VRHIPKQTNEGVPTHPITPRRPHRQRPAGQALEKCYHLLDSKSSGKMSRPAATSGIIPGTGNGDAPSNGPSGSVGGLTGHRAKKGLFTTTSEFSADAKAVVIDVETLAQLLIDQNVGVSTIGTYGIKKVIWTIFLKNGNCPTSDSCGWPLVHLSVKNIFIKSRPPHSRALVLAGNDI
jgi:hypothetical protein